MAEYTSRHTGLQIDEALDSALNVKQVRGIVKMTDAGPVAAVPDEDFLADSSSVVSVTGLLKGVRNAETNEIEVQQAIAGTDYQIPLTAGADYATPSVVVNKQNKITAQGLLKGLGDGSVAAAEAGVDYQAPIPAGTYATPDDAKPFVVTFTEQGDNIVTADKTTQEIIAAHEAGQMVLGVLLDTYGSSDILQLATIYEPLNLVAFTVPSIDTISLVMRQGSRWIVYRQDLAVPPTTATALPDSGTALTSNTIYAVATAIGTYAFTPPDTGWAHGKFTTGDTVSVSFSGTFLGAAPSIEASKTYEFDVLNGVWAVQEVVSA